MSIFNRKPNIAKMVKTKDMNGLVDLLNASDSEIQIEAYMAIKGLNSPEYYQVLKEKTDSWAQKADKDTGSWKALLQINDPRCVSIFLNMFTERSIRSDEIASAGKVITDIAMKDLDTAITGYQDATTAFAKNIMISGLLPIAQLNPKALIDLLKRTSPPAEILIEVVGLSGIKEAIEILEGINTQDEKLIGTIKSSIKNILLLNTNAGDVVLSDEERLYLREFQADLQEAFIKVSPTFVKVVPDLVLGLEDKGLMEFEAFSPDGKIMYTFTKLGKEVVRTRLK